MSDWKNTESWNTGQQVEKNFADILKQADPNFRKSTRDEQFRHIDYHSYFGTIDVKAKKRVNRGDSSYQDELIWLEFKNVQGREGWLCGETDIIAFERNDDFVLVRRKRLLEMAMSKCNIDDRVTSSRAALYRGYQRHGRKDLISLIKMKDVLEVKHTIWKK